MNNLNIMIIGSEISMKNIYFSIILININSMKFKINLNFLFLNIIKIKLFNSKKLFVFLMKINKFKIK